jgi:hypothetical protein
MVRRLAFPNVFQNLCTCLKSPGKGLFRVVVKGGVKPGGRHALMDTCLTETESRWRRLSVAARRIYPRYFQFCGVGEHKAQSDGREVLDKLQ